jgi:ketosteroid isomerase-like protein
MTVHPNVQFLRDHFVAMQRLDREALTAQFTPDVRYWAPISAEQRGFITRPLEGGANLVEMLTTLMPQLYGPERTWVIQHIFADDESGAAHVELVATLAGDGRPWRNSYAFFYRFVNGQIAELWEFTDTEYAHAQHAESAAAQTSAGH